MYSAAAERAARAGAEVIIPAEGIPNEILWHLGIHELHGLPVIDPAGLTVKLAETFVNLGELGLFTRSKHGYWFSRPDAAVTAHLEKVFLGAAL